MKAIFLLCSLCFSTKIIANDFDFTPNLQKAYSEILKLKIKNGKNLLLKENPNNAFRIFLEDRIDMIEILNSENKTQYENQPQKADTRLELIESFDEKSPYNRFLRAEMKLHSAMLKLRFGHEVKAGWEVIGAYRLLEENQKLFPKFTLNQKSLGCLHILIGSVPESQKWVTKIMGLEGDIKQGIKELKEVAKDKNWGLEAKFCELFIDAYILKFNETQNKELLQIVDNQPDNMIFQFLGTAISLKDNRTEQASQILKKWSKGEEYLEMPIYDLYAGEISLLKGIYNQAIVSYQGYVKEFTGKSFLKDTYYKIAVCYWLLNDEKKARNMVLKINVVGNSFAESDKAAQKFYENFQKTNTFPNQTLLKARLLFDGGFYEKALTELEGFSEKNFPNAKDKAEFSYRLGRIYQRINQLDKAILNLERAIFLTDINEWHFGASSALQLGYIYQAKSMKQKAKNYFEKAISYKKHEYKNSTDNKARAALTEMQ